MRSEQTACPPCILVPVPVLPTVTVHFIAALRNEIGYFKSLTKRQQQLMNARESFNRYFATLKITKGGFIAGIISSLTVFSRNELTRNRLAGYHKMHFDTTVFF